jgi:hypothetical protein
VVGEQSAQALDIVAPVAVQLAGDSEPIHRLHARLYHPHKCGVAIGAQLMEGFFMSNNVIEFVPRERQQARTERYRVAPCLADIEMIISDAIRRAKDSAGRP